MASGPVITTTEQDITHDVLSDLTRLDALARTGLLDSPEEDAFDRLTRLASRVLSAEVSLMSLVAGDRQFFKSQHGLSEPWATVRSTPLTHSFCQYVVRSGDPLVVEDARRNPLLSDNQAIDDLGVVAYAGVPLTDGGHERLGAFCVISPEPREWTAEDLVILKEISELVMTEMRLRQAVGTLHTRAAELERSERIAREAVDEIDRSARALEDAQALARVGSWEWDPVLDKISWSREMCRIIGVKEGPDTLAGYEELVAPNHQRVLQERVFGAIQTDGRWEAEHAVARPDGTARLLISRGQSITGPDGTLVLVRGTLQDVTAQREQEARFRAAFAQAPIGAAMVGLSGPSRAHWNQVNDEMQRLVGVAPRELDGVPIKHYIHPDDYERSTFELDRLARGDSERTQHEERLLHRDGHYRWTLCTRSLVRSPDGRPAYALAHYLDIGERKRYEMELEHLAHHDPLTGLFNRRRFAEELERTISHAGRYRRSGALLSFDLDHFKRVNDTAGHPAGDSVLTRVADGVGGVLRDTDVFGRLGGDEFAILLPEANGEQACRVAEKVLTVVRRFGGMAGRQVGLVVTASVGISTWNDRSTVQVAQVILRADRAMYDAKGAGGDRYTLYADALDAAPLPAA